MAGSSPAMTAAADVTMADVGIGDSPSPSGRGLGEGECS
jgi:hypothetical protein